jgi:transaldolase
VDVKELHHTYGQSVWLDYIRRRLLQSGEFARLVKDDGIRGVTSNPAIFETHCPTSAWFRQRSWA